MNYSKESRGIRNNNPLNIRRNPANQWQGLRPVQADKLFCQFKAMKWGLRAPPSENNTSGYITQACQRAGLDPDFPVLFWADSKKLLRAMCWIESRFLPSDELLEEARALSLGSAACHQAHSC